jgi:hypothetical protein
MKELFDDRITKRVKEVLEQYEPAYSPAAWEKLRKQMPVPESRLKKLLLKYKFWFSSLIIAGILLIVYNVTSIQHADEVSAIDPVSSEYENYIVSEEPKEITYSEQTSALRYGTSDINTGQKGEKVLFKAEPFLIAETSKSTYQVDTQVRSAITEIPEIIGRASAIPISSERIDFGYKYNSTQLLPVGDQQADMKLLKDPTTKKPGKFEFHWPGFNSSLTGEEDYNKFVGPNKLVVFYSPEIHYSDSIGNMGVSQGIGIAFEGPVRSLISVSAGLSYQTIDFHETILSVKVPPHDLVLQPPDTNRTFYYVDSTEIRSGSYSFIELPVSVNFKFIESPRSQVWLGAGFSSIAFLGQEYTYETVVEEISESSSVSVKAWENIHPLASLNFSVIYRYKFSEKFLLHGSIQYKQHLVPLGYNSMKLNRLNFQLGIIYNFGH